MRKVIVNEGAFSDKHVALLNRISERLHKAHTEVSTAAFSVGDAAHHERGDRPRERRAIAAIEAFRDRVRSAENELEEIYGDLASYVARYGSSV
jgi:hypothetical protein